MQTLTTLALGLEAMARVLEKYQVDAAVLFTAAGIDSQPYRDADARVPVAKNVRIWAECVRLTGNPCIGFEVGRAITAANLHAVGFAWLASRTLEEALQRLARHQSLVSTAAQMKVERTERELQLLIQADPRTPQEGVDTLLTAIVAICRQATHEDFHPLRVEMTRSRPPCGKQLTRYFGCEVVYGAGVNVIAFQRNQTQELLPRQNPALAQASDKVADDYIADMEHHDVVSRARVGLIALLASGEPSRGALAKHLHISERTLARRLSEADTSFRDLLDKTRRELALGYIRQPRYSVADVTYLLGFSDQSNFARSFKRWTGKAPVAYRQSMSDHGA